MCLISGGNWNNTTNAGVWYLNMNNNRTNSNNNVGFRCADYGLSSNLNIGYWNHRDVLSCISLLTTKRTRQYYRLFGKLFENQAVFF